MKEIIENAKRVLASSNGEARRLFHGRGKLFSDLDFINLDYFPPHLLITLYREISDAFIDELIILLDPLVTIENIWLQERFKGDRWRAYRGEFVDRTTLTEDKCQYLLKIGHGQNVGFFLDMRLVREWVKANSSEKKVLNLFAYTCSFSVAALMGNAQYVCNIDMNRRFLDWGRENHRLNQVDIKKVRFLSYNILKSFASIRRMGPFDLIVIDPPSFQRGSFIAKRDYAKVVGKMGSCLSNDGTILAALNDPLLPFEFLQEIFVTNGFGLRQRLYPPAEFEERAGSEALKIGVFTPV